MAWFDSKIATGPGNVPLPNASGQVYAYADTTHTTPLTVTFANGTTATTLTSDAVGVFPGFDAVGHTQVRWYAAGVDVVLTSHAGLLAAQTALEGQIAALRAQLETGGGGGGGGGVSVHGGLSGLTNDDHPQYHNDARGDARYFTKAQVDLAVQEARNNAVATSLPRANHTGTQAISTITGLQAALDARKPILVLSDVSEVPPGTPVNTPIIVPSVATFGPAPTVIGSDTSSSNAAGATLVVDIPSTGTPAAGDYIVVALTSMSSAIAQAWTAPDGTWTLLSPALIDLGSGQNSNTRVTAVFAKLLTGAPAASYTFTSPGSDSQRRIAAVTVVRNVDAGAPVASASALVGVNGAGTSDVTIPALASTRPRTLQLVYGWSNGSSSDDFATLPVPTPSLTSVTSETLPASGSVSKTQLVAWSRENAAAGPLSSIVQDFTARSQRAGFSVVLNPEVA